MNPAAALRRLARPIVGRSSGVWRVVRSPRLRLLAFGDTIDCVIYGLLTARSRVRFVQIGSHDGRRNDPLWSFRHYPGWNGVLVEPVEAAFARLRSNYGRWPDRFTLEQAAIAPEGGVGEIYHIDADGTLPPDFEQLASLRRDLAERHAALVSDLDTRIEARRVRCLTFEELCTRHGITDLDLLHIDAEGLDARILRQVDLARLRPAVVLYEHVHLTEPECAATLTMLRDAAYDALAGKHDTLAVSREALTTLPALARAWRLASRPRLK